MRLTQKGLDNFKKEQYDKQDHKCALCGRELDSIPKQQHHLDHDHVNGHCRKILCAICNGLEGKIYNRVNIIIKNSDIEFSEWVRNLADYWDEDYTENPLHPTHLNQQIKRFSRLSAQEQNQILQEHGVTDCKNQKDRNKEIRKLLKEGKYNI